MTGKQLPQVSGTHRRLLRIDFPLKFCIVSLHLQQLVIELLVGFHVLPHQIDDHHNASKHGQQEDKGEG